MSDFNQNLSYVQSKYYITSRTNKKGIITDASKAFCEISGYSIYELIGSNHNIVRHPDNPKELFEDMWKTIKSGKVWTGIVKNRAKSGKAYYVDTAIEPIKEKGEVVGYLSVRFDVTNNFLLEKKNIELKSSLKKFQSLFENMNGGIVIIDKEGYIKKVNPYFYSLLGYTQSEMIGKNYKLFFKENDSIDINNEFENILKNIIEKHKITKEAICKNDKKIWFELTFSAYDGRDILISLKNIEAYKKLENTSKIMITQSRDAAMGEMLAMISHQWRQPLATISAILSKAKVHKELGLYDDNKIDKDFSKISNVVQHLSKTIEFFRNYFKPKNEQKESIKNIFESLKTIVEPLAKKSEIQINYIFNDNELIKIDSRVDQVLLNLIKNSIDAYIERDIKGDIDIEMILKQESIKIKVCDYAGGIPENIIDRVFEPYFSTKSKNGTGLGLYMSKNIIEDILNGQLLIKNGQKGACFTINVPTYVKEKNEN